MTPQEACDAKIANEIRSCDHVIENATKLKAALPHLFPILEVLKTKRYLYCYPAGARIIIGVTTRDDLAKVRALHKGKWDRSDVAYDPEDTLKYSATVDGILIDCRCQETPPSCHVVETTELIPATVKKVRRIVCDEPTKEDASNGKILSVETTPVEEAVL